MNDLAEAKDRTLTIERTFDAPLTLVWAAWSDPAHITNWWGPNGMQTEVEAHDFRVGGTWRYSMKMPNGSLFIAEGVYAEIVEHEKIVTSADFKPMTEGVEMHMLFKEVDGKTYFSFHVIHPTEAYCKQQEDMGFFNGWGSTFERLGEYLQSV
ncbi:MAG: SRPBCC domain-containing protein [Bacteroidota bacterium]